MVAALKKVETRTHCLWCGNPLPENRRRSRKYCVGNECRSNFNNQKRSKANRYDSLNVVSLFNMGNDDSTRQDSVIADLIATVETQQQTIQHQSEMIDGLHTMIELLQGCVAELNSRLGSGSTANNSSKHQNFELPPPNFDDDMPTIEVKSNGDSGVQSGTNLMNSILALGN